MKTLIKVKLRFPAYVSGKPDQAEAIGEGYETEKQIIVTKATITRTTGPIWGHRSPVRFNKRTGRKLGIGLLLNTWVLDRTEGRE